MTELPQLQPRQTRMQQVEQLQAENARLTKEGDQALPSPHEWVRRSDFEHSLGQFDTVVAQRDAALAQIVRLTKELDALKSEAAELAADLRRAMAENERVRETERLLREQVENLLAENLRLHALEQLAGDQT